MSEAGGYVLGEEGEQRNEDKDFSNPANAGAKVAQTSHVKRPEGSQLQYENQEMEENYLVRSTMTSWNKAQQPKCDDTQERNNRGENRCAADVLLLKKRRNLKTEDPLVQGGPTEKNSPLLTREYWNSLLLAGALPQQPVSACAFIPPPKQEESTSTNQERIDHLEEKNQMPDEPLIPTESADGSGMIGKPLINSNKQFHNLRYFSGSTTNTSSDFSCGPIKDEESSAKNRKEEEVLMNKKATSFSTTSSRPPDYGSSSLALHPASTRVKNGRELSQRHSDRLEQKLGSQPQPSQNKDVDLILPALAALRHQPPEHQSTMKRMINKEKGELFLHDHSSVESGGSPFQQSHSSKRTKLQFHSFGAGVLGDFGGIGGRPTSDPPFCIKTSTMTSPHQEDKKSYKRRQDWLILNQVQKLGHQLQRLEHEHRILLEKARAPHLGGMTRRNNDMTFFLDHRKPSVVLDEKISPSQHSVAVNPKVTNSSSLSSFLLNSQQNAVKPSFAATNNPLAAASTKASTVKQDHHEILAVLRARLSPTGGTKRKESNDDPQEGNKRCATENQVTAVGVTGDRHATQKRKKYLSFPVMLYEMIEEAERESCPENEAAIAFFPHGKAFSIRDPPQFVLEVMPKYMKTTRLASFQRQLNFYGFTRIAAGPERGGYFHKQFVRGKKYLCAKIGRQKTPSCLLKKQGKKPSKNLPKNEEDEENRNGSDEDGAIAVDEGMIESLDDEEDFNDSVFRPPSSAPHDENTRSFCNHYCNEIKVGENGTARNKISESQISSDSAAAVAVWSTSSTQKEKQEDAEPPEKGDARQGNCNQRSCTSGTSLLDLSPPCMVKRSLDAYQHLLLLREERQLGKQSRIQTRGVSEPSKEL